MTIKLSPDQIEDAMRMATTPDLPNFSKAGTGKTHTALEAIRLTGFKRNLIIAPPIAINWWVEQAREFLGADARAMKSGSSPLVGDILVTTYGIAANARARLYEEFDGGSLTVDESHFVASVDAKRTQTIYGNAIDLAGGLAERFDTVWNMSGNPKQNHANDYYTQVGVLHPDELAKYGIHNYDEFCRKFTYKQERQYHPRMRPVWKIVGSSNEALLRRIIYKEIGAIRRTSSEGMPKLRYRELRVSATIPREVRRELKGLTSSEIIAKFNDPDSIVAKAWHVAGLSKVPEVVPYIGDSVKDSPVLVGCWHRDVMDEYEEHLTKMGLRVVQVHGDTPANQLDGIRKQFNNGEIDALIGQMRKMGVSWNIQEASNHVIITEEYPSPAVIEQFYGRVYRRGQQRDCTVDVILCDGFEVDEALNGVRKRKEESDRKIAGEEK